MDIFNSLLWITAESIVQLSSRDCRCQQAVPDCIAGDNITLFPILLKPEMVEKLTLLSSSLVH